MSIYTTKRLRLVTITLISCDTCGRHDAFAAEENIEPAKARNEANAQGWMCNDEVDMCYDCLTSLRTETNEWMDRIRGEGAYYDATKTI